MNGFYDDILPRFMDKYGKKWGVKTQDIELPNLEESARSMHAVPVTEEMKESVMDGQTMFRSVATDNNGEFGDTGDVRFVIRNIGWVSSYKMSTPPQNMALTLCFTR